jgi:hypothetical protein
MEGKYNKFCEESKCVHYNAISRLESISNPSEDITRQLAIIKIHCKQRCERSADQFYNWLKINSLIN